MNIIQKKKFIIIIIKEKKVISIVKRILMHCKKKTNIKNNDKIIN